MRRALLIAFQAACRSGASSHLSAKLFPQSGLPELLRPHRKRATRLTAPPPHSGHRDEKGRRRGGRRPRDRPHLADVGRLLPVLLPAPQQTPFGVRHGPRTRGGETAARRKRRKRRRRKRGRKRRRRKRGRKRRRKRGENGGGGGGTGGRSGGNEGLERRRRKRAAGRKARLRSASTGTALAADWMAGRFARGKQRVAREGMGWYGPRKLRADAVTFCSHTGREGCAPLGGPGPRKENAPSAETDKGRSAVAGRAGGHREEEGLAVDVVQVDPSRQLPHLAAPPPPQSAAAAAAAASVHAQPEPDPGGSLPLVVGGSSVVAWFLLRAPAPMLLQSRPAGRHMPRRVSDPGARRGADLPL